MYAWICSVLLMIPGAVPAPAAVVATAVCARFGDDSAGANKNAPPKKGDAPRVERAEDAKQQLKKADEARRAVTGKGEERRALVVKAIAAYSAVLEYFPEAKTEASMGAFRLGELNRSLGLNNEAKDAFAKVATLGGDRKIQARALFETAHLYRRTKELGKALETYRKVATNFADEVSTHDDSLYWIGMLHSQNKEYDKARESWRIVADQGGDPLDRIRAFDRIAGAYVKEGKRDQAVKIIEESKTALHDAAAEPSTRGARVRKALERMSSIRAIERLDAKESPKENTKGKVASQSDEDDDDDELDG